MRRAAVLAILFVLALGGVAQAKTSVDKVAGTFTYDAFPDLAEGYRELSVSAQATDPVKGSWTWTRPNGTFSGPVTCLRVDGDDAWIAGYTAPASELLGVVFFWVHDGGRPAGDRVFGWAADLEITLEDMEAVCESMGTAVPIPGEPGEPGGWFPIDPVPLLSGNVTIHPAK